MVFNKLEEIEKYYNKETNTYIFKENDEWIELVELKFNLEITCDINARDINARAIKACDINARDIKACDINAWDINFFACCISYQNIICKKIEGRRDNSKYLTLDGEIVIKDKKDEK